MNANVKPLASLNIRFRGGKADFRFGFYNLRKSFGEAGVPPKVALKPDGRGIVLGGM